VTAHAEHRGRYHTGRQPAVAKLVYVLPLRGSGERRRHRPGLPFRSSWLRRVAVTPEPMARSTERRGLVSFMGSLG